MSRVPAEEADCRGLLDEGAEGADAGPTAEETPALECQNAKAAPFSFAFSLPIPAEPPPPAPAPPPTPRILCSTDPFPTPPLLPLPPAPERWESWPEEVEVLEPWCPTDTDDETVRDLMEADAGEEETGLTNAGVVAKAPCRFQ